MLVILLARSGKIVSPIKMIPIGTKSPLLKHVVSFRRYVYIILQEQVLNVMKNAGEKCYFCYNRL